MKLEFLLILRFKLLNMMMLISRESQRLYLKAKKFFIGNLISSFFVLPQFDCCVFGEKIE
jgi:hypothetical protein